MFSINSFLSKAAVAAALLFPVQAAAQCVIDKPAYMLYTDEGMPSSFGDMIEAMAQSDVIFFGEYHNSSVVHWLERVVFTSLADRLDNKLTLGMEMFEADTQLKVDEYMAGLISEERFLAETYLWDNYKTDYAPVVKCAKERGIRLIATNVPRRYARAVSVGNVDALRKFPQSSQLYFGKVLERVEAIQEPNPFFTKASAMLKTVSAKHDETSPSKALTNEQKQQLVEKTLCMTRAQALKDAVMARNIADNLTGVFIHINGNYHSDCEKLYVRKQNRCLALKSFMSVCWQYDVEISFASINWIQFRQFVLIDRGNSYDPDCRSELFKICNNTFPTILFLSPTGKSFRWDSFFYNRTNVI